jgi:hypothetical protein
MKISSSEYWQNEEWMTVTIWMIPRHCSDLWHRNQGKDVIYKHLKALRFNGKHWWFAFWWPPFFSALYNFGIELYLQSLHTWRGGCHTCAFGVS